MAIPLLKGETIEDLDFTEGMVLVLKSNKFNLTPVIEGVLLSRIPLYNSMGDILLEIVFRKGRNMIFVNDRASKAIGKGWGKPKIVDLGPGDVDKWWRSGITISVHHRSTASGFGRYQILFGLTTICYFDKRFPGGATQVKYLSNKLHISCNRYRHFPKLFAGQFNNFNQISANPDSGVSSARLAEIASSSFPFARM
jgi:hypothetical protein